MGGFRYVSDFEFPSEAGFSGSSKMNYGSGGSTKNNHYAKGGHACKHGYADPGPLPKNVKKRGGAMHKYADGGHMDKLYSAGHDMGFKNAGYKPPMKKSRGGGVQYSKMDDMDHANVQRKKSLASDQRVKEFGDQGELEPGFKKGGHKKYKKGGSCKENYAEGGKWIQKAIKKPGSLRKSLGVKEGEKIPASKLEKAAKKSGKMGKRARLAETLRGFDKKAKGGLAKANDYTKEMMSDHIRAAPPKGHGVKGGLKGPNKRAKGGYNSKPMYGRGS